MLVSVKDAAFVLLLFELLPRCRVEDQASRSRSVVKIEQIVQRPGDSIGRTAPDAAKSPVVFNEPKNRGLIGDRVVNEAFRR